MFISVRYKIGQKSEKSEKRKAIARERARAHARLQSSSALSYEPSSSMSSYAGSSRTRLAAASISCGSGVAAGDTGGGVGGDAAGGSGTESVFFFFFGMAPVDGWGTDGWCSGGGGGGGVDCWDSMTWKLGGEKRVGSGTAGRRVLAAEKSPSSTSLA
jgi:hypothetical protein